MKTLNNLVKEVFGVKESEISDEMSPETIANWDSFNYLLFVSEIEKNFKVQLTMDELMKAKNLGDIRKCLIERGVKWI